MGQEKIIRFEDVKHQSTEDYFNDSKFSIDAFNKKYKAHADETYVQALKRVCDYIASVEDSAELQKYWSERWFDEIYNDWWHPAGSIMQGAIAGKNISLCNCTTISMGSLDHDLQWDNLEGIIKNTAYTVAKCAAYRQGLGVDFSRLRPIGTKVLNSSSESSGAVHWMKFIDSIGYYVGQKGRIPAMLFSISCSHPDVEEFITIKSDYTKIQNANISVQCTDEFYHQVEVDGDWELFFEIPEVVAGQKVYVDVHNADKDTMKDENGYYFLAKKDRPYEKYSKIVKARKLLELIAKNMMNNAEPGIQNISLARKYSNSDYVYDPNDEYDSRILSTNACSEQYLSRESLCVLASANCGKFSTDSEVYEKELYKIGESVNRFLDNVNECELRYKTYATPHQRVAIQKLRRTGAGYTNLADWLFRQNLAYGTQEANDVVEHFTQRYNYHLYRSSIALGHEKGSFGLFNKEKYTQSPFIKRMQELGLEFDAMRNCTCSSIAPTGTLSLMFRDCVFSYGIEPAFGLYFWKRTRIEGSYKYYFCVPKTVKDYFEKNNCPIPMDGDTVQDTWDGQIGRPIVAFIEKHKAEIGLNFANSTEIKPLDKLDLMSKVMKWIDSSISVTYMLPEESSWKDIYDFILEAHKKEVKSIAAFPDKKMYGIVSFIPFKDLAFKLKNESIQIHQQNFTSGEYEELYGESVSMDKIIKNNAPKRPKSLSCHVYHSTIKSIRYYTVVGLLCGEPYEIFCGMNHDKDGEILIPRNVSDGVVKKEKRGCYILVDKNNKEYHLTNGHLEESHDAVCRLISISLRHGTSVDFITDQLGKTRGDLQSFSRILARVLKNYIQDGSIVKGMVCENCKHDGLERFDGCIRCPACLWSKC